MIGDGRKLVPEGKRPRGRETKFTWALGRTICERIARGETLTSMCKEDGFPVHINTIMDWVREDIGPGFGGMYARARLTQADVWADELHDISRTPTTGIITTTIDGPNGRIVKTIEQDAIEHRRLQVDSKKWLLARLNRKKYGDNAKFEIDTDESGTLKIKIENDPDASS